MNASPLWVCVRTLVCAPQTLVVLKLVNVPTDLQGAFLSMLSAFGHIDAGRIVGLNNAKSEITERLMVQPV